MVVVLGERFVEGSQVNVDVVFFFVVGLVFRGCGVDSSFLGCFGVVFFGLRVQSFSFIEQAFCFLCLSRRFICIKVSYSVVVFRIELDYDKLGEDQWGTLFVEIVIRLVSYRLFLVFCLRVYFLRLLNIVLWVCRGVF